MGVVMGAKTGVAVRVAETTRELAGTTGVSRNT